jgi:hypothetical protein
MPSSEERMRVLQMVAEGKITPEDGVRLLEALRAGEAADKRPTAPSQNQPRWFRVRVTDSASGRDKVNINIPIGLVNVGLKMGARFVDEREGIDFEQLTTLVQSGQMGKILEVEDTEKGERVEIFAE